MAVNLWIGHPNRDFLYRAENMKLLRSLSLTAVVLCAISGVFTSVVTATQPQAAPGVVRQIGSIKAVSGNSVTLTPDSGADVTVVIAEGARLLRMEPGQQDLKSATAAQMQDLQVGDRLLVRGKMSDDNKSLIATLAVVMKKNDLAAKHQQELQDWQRRGIGGLVKSVDPATGTIEISMLNGTGLKTVAIKTSKSTVVRRYAPDSVHFDDAKLSTIAEIKPGDQLRARGVKNADSTELAAEEIVSGTFRNISGTVSSVDAANKTITVMDLATKKPAVIRITNESQMHKLPEMLARGLALRLKGAAPDGPNGPAGSPGRPTMPEPGARSPMGGNTGAAPGGPEQARGRGGDLQQMLNRLPPMPFTELQKGDVVMIVSTPGSTTSNMTAITLLSGVEPILAANSSGAASLLSPWSLASAPEGGGGPEQ
jgi:hypothetical protein